jgi:hypothetical protein
MLDSAMSEQIKSWILKTDAHGEQLCVTLVIAEFRLQDSPDPLPDRQKIPDIPSILRLSIDVEAVMLSDPGGTLSWTTKGRLKYAFRRIKARLSPNHNSGPHCCKPIE